MLTMTEINKLYADKLLETGSHDKAMLKVVWVAYQQGIAHGIEHRGENE
jgi:hypothetical protein